MNALLKFFRLRASDKILFMRVVGLLILVRLGLTFVGYNKLMRRMPPVGERPARPIQPGRIAWAVRNLAPAIPKASCLTQAITAQYLMNENGEPSEIQVGVTQGAGGAFEAHAWLTWEGKVVIGGDRPLQQYTPITTLAATRR